MSEWETKVYNAAWYNYYACSAFIFMHPLFMAFVFDFWANFNYLLIAISAQQMMLCAFCWAVSDEKYEFWITQKMWFYYTLSFFNLVGFIFGMGVGIYYYAYGAGLYSFMGL